MLIAQLSDSHIKAHGELAYGRVDTEPFLRAAVRHLNDLVPRPDVVLLTGDLTDDATPEQMSRVCDMLAGLEAPLLPIPGNHDDRALFRDAFPHIRPALREGPFFYVAEDYPVRLVLLDSSVPGQPHGALCAETLAWLEDIGSADDDRPMLVGLHHPPFEVGIRHMDVQNLRNADELAKWVASTPQVLAVVCGHIHRYITVEFAGVPGVIAPAPAHAVALDLLPDAIPELVLEPPAVLLHLWSPGEDPRGRLATHISFIGDFGPRSRFFGDQ